MRLWRYQWRLGLFNVSATGMSSLMHYAVGVFMRLSLLQIGQKGVDWGRCSLKPQAHREQSIVAHCGS